MRAGEKAKFSLSATAFETVANIYSPYYRQSSAEVLLLPHAEQNKVIGGAPTQDGLAAFDYYIEHFNKGRPFILAGHSQGSNVMVNVLAQYMGRHPDVYRRMIVAYVIGYSVTADYLAKNPELRFASGPDDTGVIVSYNTVAPTLKMPDPVVWPGAMVINPITWTRTEATATPDQNLGGISVGPEDRIRGSRFGGKSCEGGWLCRCTNRHLKRRAGLQHGGSGQAGAGSKMAAAGITTPTTIRSTTSTYERTRPTELHGTWGRGSRVAARDPRAHGGSRPKAFGRGRSRLRYRLTASLLVLAAMCVLTALGCHPKSSSQSVSNLLVNGRRITPAGTTSGPIGGMPLNIALSPDGKYAVTTSSCLDARLSTIRMRDGAIVGSLTFPADDPRIPNGGLFYGLVFDPTPRDGKYVLYAAQGAYGDVAVVTLASKNGSLTKSGSIPSRPVPYMPVDQPGIALANGTLFLANYFSVDLKAVYQPASTLSMYRASDGTRLGSYTFADAATTNTPSFPYAVAARSDGTRAYVASQRDGCVYVLDTSRPNHTVLVSKIAHLGQPSALLLNKAQTVLYIANAGSDTITSVDVAEGRAQVKATALLRPPNVASLPGVSPSGLALSPDEKTLYASLGDFNAVGVVDTGTNALRGYIPVGWYPTALTTAEQGRVLYVVNGWGTSAKNPNPGFNYLNPDVVGINSAVKPPTWLAPPGPGYVLNSIPGNVSRIDLSKSLPTLATLTARTIQNNQNTSAMGNTGDKTLAGLGIKTGKIKHVIYVVKENRGYDQVLGDLPKGNGDPSLTLYGRQVTPNQHALAERFVLLDNFYNNAPVSGEGWVWCTQSLANAYTVKAIPYVYQLSLPTYQINYGFEGQVNGYITGGYPARDQDGNWLSVTHAALPSIPDVAESSGGYIWDGVRSAGLTFRNYGFFLSNGAPSEPPYEVPDNYPSVAGLSPPGHVPTPKGRVAGYSDYDYRRFDFGFADSDAWLKRGLDATSVGLTTGNPPGYYASLRSPVPPQPSRISEWNREFQELLKQDPTGGDVPAFMTVRLGRDHTMGLNRDSVRPER